MPAKIVADTMGFGDHFRMKERGLTHVNPFENTCNRSLLDVLVNYMALGLPPCTQHLRRLRQGSAARKLNQRMRDRIDSNSTEELSPIRSGITPADERTEKKSEDHRSWYLN